MSSDKMRRTRHSRLLPHLPPSRDGDCRGRSLRSAPEVPEEPSPPPPCRPAGQGALRRRRDASPRLMLSLTMKATPASAQIRCSGSARRANSCSADILHPQLEMRRRTSLSDNGLAAGRETSRQRPAARSDRDGTAPFASAAGTQLGSNSSSKAMRRPSRSKPRRSRRSPHPATRSNSVFARVLSKIREQRAREAGDHARVLGELAAGIGTREAAGQSNDAKHPRMVDQRIERARASLGSKA